MERRYLAATLALAATFAIFSGEFCTRYLAKVPHSPAEVKADIACAKQYVAKQVLAKLESFTGQRMPEQQPMLAELNTSEVPQAPPAIAPVVPLGAKCSAKPLVPKAPQQLVRMRVMAGDGGHGLIDHSIVRAELLSQRGQEWQLLANQRMIEMNMKSSMERAQKISAQAMRQAQRQIEKSSINIVIPPVTSKAIHINFVAPSAVVTPEPPTPAVY
jgi:hypothetical protein